MGLNLGSLSRSQSNSGSMLGRHARRRNIAWVLEDQSGNNGRW
jgi:hypothetical protein